MTGSGGRWRPPAAWRWPATRRLRDGKTADWEGRGWERAGARAHRDEEAGRVDNLGGAEELLDGGGVEVLLLVAVRRRQVGDERPLATLDEHRARAGWLSRLLHVLHVDAVATGRLLELLAEGIVADAANVGSAARRAGHPLRHADRVLRRPTGDVLDRLVLDEISVQRRVLGLGEDLARALDAPPAQEDMRQPNTLRRSSGARGVLLQAAHLSRTSCSTTAEMSRSGFPKPRMRRLSRLAIVIDCTGGTADAKGASVWCQSG